MTALVLADSPSSSPYSKIVFLGDRGVGKTSLIRRIASNMPPNEEYHPTIGIRIHNFDVLIAGQQQYLQFWDVSGNAIYSSLLPSLLKNASCVVLIFDYLNTHSQNTIQSKYEEIRTYNEQVPIILIGNKAEGISSKEEVPKLLNRWITDHKLAIFAVSAKKGSSISLVMNKILWTIETIKKAA